MTPSSAAKSSPSASGAGALPAHRGLTIRLGLGIRPWFRVGIGPRDRRAGRQRRIDGRHVRSRHGGRVRPGLRVRPGPDALSTPRRSPVAEALRLETLLVAPRAMTGQSRTSSTMTAPRTTSTATRTRNGTTVGFFQPVPDPRE